MRKLFYNFAPLLSLTVLVPVVVYAQTSGGLGSFRDIVNGIGKFISGTIIPILFGIAVLAFMWNIIHFILNSSNEVEREKFKKYSLNAILAMFIMFGVWGIIGIGTRTLFGVAPFVPQLPTQEQ